MSIFSRRPRLDTDNAEYIRAMIKEELAEFQKELDETCNYRITSSRMDVGCYQTYATQPKDAMLLRVEVVPQRSTGAYSTFSMLICFTLIDMFLHPEDVYKSAYEKYNKCSLRPVLSKTSKEDLAGYGLDSLKITQYIRDKKREIADRIESHVLNRFGTQCYCNLPDTHEIRVYSGQGKPEQYKEYCANIAKYDRSYTTGMKDLARKFGYTLTDEDIRNSAGINYLLK